MLMRAAVVTFHVSEAAESWLRLINEIPLSHNFGNGVP
jgi:hypothetical protein